MTEQNTRLEMRRSVSSVTYWPCDLGQTSDSPGPCLFYKRRRITPPVLRNEERGKKAGLFQAISQLYMIQT